MARKRKESGKNLWNKAKWRGFLNVRLQESEKKHIKDNLLAPESIAQMFEDMATDGYKVSVSYSIPEDVFTVSVTGTYEEKANAGICMSIRHRDFAVAVTAVAHCHNQAMADGSWEDRYTVFGENDW